MLQTFWNWLVLSSRDPQRTSLLVKGVLGTLSTIGLLALGIFHFAMPQQGDINSLIDLIILAINATLTAISYVAAAISAWAMVWGAIRKIALTLTGDNQALQ